MFRIVCDPSLGSIELYLTEIRAAARRTVNTHHWFKNYAAKHRPSTRHTSVNHYEFQSSTALYSLMMSRIRSETCRSDNFMYFKLLYNVDFNF